jgi:hypothetical protein
VRPATVGRLDQCARMSAARLDRRAADVDRRRRHWGWSATEGWTSAAARVLVAARVCKTCLISCWRG